MSLRKVLPDMALMEHTTIHFLNVGHGDCTIIEHPSGNLTMIDINNSHSLPEDDEVALAALHQVSLSEFRHGLFAKSLEAMYRERLVDPRTYYREHFGTKSLFRYVQSHPDMDHMSGLASLFWGEKVALTNFWDVQHGKQKLESDFTGGRFNWNDWLAYEHLRGGNGADGSTHKVLHKTHGESGDHWTSDGMTVLSPTQDLLDYCDRLEDWNNASYVFRLDYAGRRVMLPGDAEGPAWDSIQDLHAADELKCDILKAAHHGRESGYSTSAVEAIDPEVVICSIGKKPSTDASDEYRSHGAKVLSTRFHGTIKCTIWADGEVWIDDHKGDRQLTLQPLAA